MDKYLLFSGDVYYPLGGWEDFQGYFDSVEEALLAAGRHPYGWIQVVYRGNIVKFIYLDEEVDH